MYICEYNTDKFHSKIVYKQLDNYGYGSSFMISSLILWYNWKSLTTVYGAWEPLKNYKIAVNGTRRLLNAITLIYDIIERLGPSFPRLLKVVISDDTYIKNLYGNRCLPGICDFSLKNSVATIIFTSLMRSDFYLPLSKVTHIMVILCLFIIKRVKNRLIFMIRKINMTKYL